MNVAVNLQYFLSSSAQRRSAWAMLFLLVILNVPLLLGTPLHGDASYYDLQVQCLNEGGVLYRDMLEPNFPGVVWIHMFVRTIMGASSLALRAFDLLVLTGVLLILMCWIRRHGNSSPNLASPCLALSVYWFYFSLVPSSQCQRDLWMLLPSLGAMLLRERCLVWTAQRSTRAIFAVSLLEGMLWACAFWIKPHSAVPALFVLTASMLCNGFSRQAFLGLAGVISGGILAGAIGTGWLMASGAWPHFVEMQLEWNSEYLASRSKWNWTQRCVSLFQAFSPWCWAHFAAIPLTIYPFVAALRRRPLNGPEALTKSCRQLLLCALYLGWFLQSVLLQHPFGYTHVPGVLLSLAVVANTRWNPAWTWAAHPVIAAICLIAFILSPCTKLKRYASWKDCVMLRPTYATQEAIEARPSAYWKYYPELVQFLRERRVSGKDVLVYSSSLVGLYKDLDLRPPTRYVLTDVLTVFFSSRVPQIERAIRNSSHRYVVSDMSGLGLDPKALDGIDPHTGLPATYPPEARHRFPATQPVIFRSGWFVVHEARKPMGPLITQSE